MKKQEESEKLGFNEMIKKALREYFEREIDRLVFEFLCREQEDMQKEKVDDEQR